MWVGFIAILIASVAITAVGWYGWQEKLPRNNFAGIRTRYTMASDEQWKAVHHYGAPFMIFGGVAAFAASLAILPFALFADISQTFAASVLLAIAILIAGTGLMAWQSGVKAAKRHLAQPAD